MKCERIEKCVFFNGLMANMPSESDKIKKRYCADDSITCARALVADKLGVDAVPDDLFPDDMLRALSILNTAAID